MVYATGLTTTAGSGAASASEAGAAATTRLVVRLEPSSGGAGELAIRSFLGTTTSGIVLGLQYGATNVTLPVSPVASAPGILRARPNPFVAETEIAFVLPSAARASVRLFDVNGRLVRTLHDGAADAGVNRLRWDGNDDRGRTAGVGIYFVQFTSGGVARTERILRLR